MAVTWTTEMIDRLIDLYEERPCLYNTKMKEYHDRDLRKKALEEIATALDVSGEFIIRIVPTLTPTILGYVASSMHDTCSTTGSTF